MAGEKTFPFEILTLQKQFFSEDVRFVIAPGQEGLFEILAGHAPFVFALKPGQMQIRRPDGSDEYVAVGSGFLVVQKDLSTALVRSAEHAAEIDVERAKRARERAEKRLSEPAPELDMDRAKLALQRALARLKVAERAHP